MKLLYIALCDLCANGEAGIRKKVWAQINCLSGKFDTYLVSWENFLVCTYHGEQKISKKVLLCYADIYEYITDYAVSEGIGVIYLRYLQTNPWLNRFLKDMKRKGIKVIVEFPTVPYEEELKGRVELEEDTLYRKGLKRHVRYSVNYNGLDRVFGIPSVAVHNGINIEDVPLKKERGGKDIVLIAVAGMNFWHGYDRLIKGMAEYYREGKNKGGPGVRVLLKLVGLGKEIPRYRDLIREYGLWDYISIEGMQSAEALDRLFDGADMAVGSLGIFRAGNATTNSAIKTKEYCARGLPIILGKEDLAFRDAPGFVYVVPSDESPIDLMDIVRFYSQYKKKGEWNSRKIRGYAEQKLTWDKQFDKVYRLAGL